MPFTPNVDIDRDPYDAVPYPGTAYPATHPNNLAVQALLHGLNPAPVATCRVLEVGCNEGRNLIPMAYAIPGGDFVGFDLAAEPIERGRERILQLGLTNIQLFQADLLDLAETHPGLGQFDYIIAHGVYAWVPPLVADALLALCGRLLSPHGVAFISYNALPGGHFRTVIREMLQHSTVASGSTAEQLAHSVEFLRFVAASRPQGDPYRQLLEREITHLPEKGAHVVFHDELAGSFRPVSFTSFVSHAAAHGLQYLADSTLPLPSDLSFNPEIANVAKALANGDPIAEEQTLDFVRMRMYRETLLCRKQHAISRDHRLDAWANLRLSSQTQAIPQPAEDTDSDAGDAYGSRTYKLPEAINNGVSMTSRHKPTIALMDLLVASWPESIPMPQIQHLLKEQGLALDAQLATLLLRLVIARMIDVHAWAAPVSRSIAERPLAALTARQGIAQDSRLITLLHSVIDLPDPLVRDLLLLLDGTRDREALLMALQAAHAETPASTLTEGLEPSLHLLHRAGLLHSA